MHPATYVLGASASVAARLRPHIGPSANSYPHHFAASEVCAYSRIRYTGLPVLISITRSSRTRYTGVPVLISTQRVIQRSSLEWTGRSNGALRRICRSTPLVSSHSIDKVDRSPRLIARASRGECPIGGPAGSVQADLAGRGDVDHEVCLAVPGTGEPVPDLLT